MGEEKEVKQNLDNVWLERVVTYYEEELSCTVFEAEDFDEKFLIRLQNTWFNYPEIAANILHYLPDKNFVTWLINLEKHYYLETGTSLDYILEKNFLDEKFEYITDLYEAYPLSPLKVINFVIKENDRIQNKLENESEFECKNLVNRLDKLEKMVANIRQTGEEKMAQDKNDLFKMMAMMTMMNGNNGINGMNMATMMPMLFLGKGDSKGGFEDILKYQMISGMMTPNSDDQKDNMGNMMPMMMLMGEDMGIDVEDMLINGFDQFMILAKMMAKAKGVPFNDDAAILIRSGKIEVPQNMLLQVYLGSSTVNELIKMFGPKDAKVDRELEVESAVNAVTKKGKK